MRFMRLHCLVFYILVVGAFVVSAQSPYEIINNLSSINN